MSENFIPEKINCPKCKELNPFNSEYCWKCFYDFKPEPQSMRQPKFNSLNQGSSGKIDESKGEMTAFLIMLIFSILIVGASWWVFNFFYRAPDSLKIFCIGWVVLLVVIKLSEGLLPNPDPNPENYFSMNPFEYRDDMNRRILTLHVFLFLPRVVLKTIILGLTLFK